MYVNLSNVEGLPFENLEEIVLESEKSKLKDEETEENLVQRCFFPIVEKIKFTNKDQTAILQVVA